MEQSILVTGGGPVLGALIAAGLSVMLVKVLIGVFDPPPNVLAVPWAYLLATAAVAVAATAIGGALVLRALKRSPISVLRDL